MNDSKRSNIALTADREKVIVKTSLIGIITNILLAAFKAVVGVIANSIALILDAVNNLSDALSSVVTLLGAKLGAKAPDKKHPMGYGRIEYLSAFIVAGLVLYAGITAAVASVKKIIHPETASYNTVYLIVIVVAIGAKLVLGSFVKKQGDKVNSAALVNSGIDAKLDAFLSLSVLISALIYIKFELSLEAYVGVAISFVIIKSGIEMMRDTVDDLIGPRYSGEISDKIRKILEEEPEIRGVYDLVLFNYGPDKFYGSVHMELPDYMTIEEADVLTRRVQMKVYQKLGVILTGVGVYSYNTSNDEAAKIRNTVQKTVMAHPWALQMHGFYADTEEKSMRFDVVISFDVDRSTAVQTIRKEVQTLYPDYKLSLVPDVDFVD